MHYFDPWEETTPEQDSKKAYETVRRRSHLQRKVDDGLVDKTDPEAGIGGFWTLSGQSVSGERPDYRQLVEELNVDTWYVGEYPDGFPLRTLKDDQRHAIAQNFDELQEWARQLREEPKVSRDKRTSDAIEFTPRKPVQGAGQTRAVKARHIPYPIEVRHVGYQARLHLVGLPVVLDHQIDGLAGCSGPKGWQEIVFSILAEAALSLSPPLRPLPEGREYERSEADLPIVHLRDFVGGVYKRQERQ